MPVEDGGGLGEAGPSVEPTIDPQPPVPGESVFEIYDLIRESLLKPDDVGGVRPNRLRDELSPVEPSVRAVPTLGGPDVERHGREADRPDLRRRRPRGALSLGRPGPGKDHEDSGDSAPRGADGPS